MATDLAYHRCSPRGKMTSCQETYHVLYLSHANYSAAQWTNRAKRITERWTRRTESEVASRAMSSLVATHSPYGSL